MRSLNDAYSADQIRAMEDRGRRSRSSRSSRSLRGVALGISGLYACGKNRLCKRIKNRFCENKSAEENPQEDKIRRYRNAAGDFQVSYINQEQWTLPGKMEEGHYDHPQCVNRV